MQLAASFAAVAVGSGAAAAAGPLELTWEAPPGCPERAHVVRDIERLVADLGVDPSSVRASARIVATEGGFRVSVTTESGGEKRERTVDGSTCSELADAAALIIALASAERAHVESGPPARERVESRRPPPLPPRVPAKANGEEPKSTRATGLRLRAAAELDALALPHPAGGLGVGASFWLGRGSLDASGSYFFPARETLATRDAGVNVALFAADLRACYAPLAGRFELRGCAAFEAGSFFARGFGVSSPASAESPWLATGLGTSVTYQASGGLRLFFGVDGLIVLERQSFVIQGLGELYRPPPATVRPSLGVEFILR